MKTVNIQIPEFKFSVLLTLEENMVPLFLPNFKAQLYAKLRSGEIFEPGSMFQVGWMLTIFALNESNQLELLEPDFKLPESVTWHRGLTRTSLYAIVHNAVCDELGLEPEFCHLGNTIFSDFNTNQDTEYFTLMRRAPENNHSGWVVHFGSGPIGDMKEMLMYELGIIQKRLIPFFLLPEESFIAIANDKFSVDYKNRSISIPSGGYLATHFQS